MLAKRILTALILIPIVLGVLLGLSPAQAAVAFGVMYLLAAWEWAGFFQWTAPSQRALYVLFAALIMLGMHAVARAGFGLQTLAIAVPLWLVGLNWILRYPVQIGRSADAAFGLCSLSLAWLAMASLLNADGRGAEWVLFLFAVVWAADIGAYFAGRAFGKHKLAPKVSPGKTWEGVAGGMSCCLAVGVAGSYWFGMPVAVLAPLTVVCGLVSIVGDLTVSVFKRNAGLKDSGWLLPGHGGVLDRIDSLTAAGPWLAVGLQLANSA